MTASLQIERNRDREATSVSQVWVGNSLFIRFHNRGGQVFAFARLTRESAAKHLTACLDSMERGDAVREAVD